MQLPDVRFTLDEVRKDYTTLRHYLSTEASIFRHKLFESANIKFMSGCEHDIFESETHVVESLKVRMASAIHA